MDYKPKHKFKLDLSEVDETSNEIFVHIDCPSCGTQVGSDGLELSSKVAKCSSCNAVFPFEKELSRLKSKIEKAAVYKQPNGVEKFYFGDELDISIQQIGTGIEMMIVMLLPLTSLIGFAGVAKGKFGIFIPAVLLLISAVVIISLLNIKKHRTHVRVGSDLISVEHRPKKGRRDKIYKSRDVDQLYVTKYPNPWTGAQIYGVQMVVNSGQGQKHIRLVGGMKTMREAKFVEQEIENHLNISNEVMIEEVGNA